MKPSDLVSLTFSSLSLFFSIVALIFVLIHK